jgi:hypothetical protein
MYLCVVAKGPRKTVECYLRAAGRLVLSFIHWIMRPVDDQLQYTLRIPDNR